MRELSYTVFPIVLIVFVIFSASRTLLLPGLAAAAIVGAGNSLALEKYLYAFGHTAMLAFCFFVMTLPRKRKETDGIKYRLLSLPVWALIAFCITKAIRDDSWPYRFSKDQMLYGFVLSLPVGATVLSCQT